MSSDINKTIITARLTRDSELKYTQSGTAVCSFSIANGRSLKVNGEKKDFVSYFDCVLYGKFGEAIQPYLLKGVQVAVDGRLNQQRWEQDGNKRSKIEIVVENIQILSKPTEERSAHTDGGKPAANIPRTTADDIPPFDEHNAFDPNDIPF